MNQTSHTPRTHALAAFGYITALVSSVYYSSQIIDHVEENLFLPIGLLSTLVVSVALMGYLFFSRPVQLLLAGKQEEGVCFFLETVGYFVGIAVVVIFIGLVALPFTLNLIHY